MLPPLLRMLRPLSTRLRPGEATDAWSPLDLSNLLHWYDFSDAATITESGGNITAITAKGTDNTASVDGTGPTWSSGDKRAVASGSGVLDLASHLTGYPLIMVASFKVSADGTSTAMGRGNTGVSSRWNRLLTRAASGINSEANLPGPGINYAVDGQGSITGGANVVGAAEFATISSRRARRDANSWGTAETTSVDPVTNQTSLFGVNSNGSWIYSDSGLAIYDALFLTAITEDEWTSLLSYLQAKHS